MEEWQQIEVDGKTWIPFNYQHPQYGVSHWRVCVKFFRRKILEFWVYPIQQDLNTCWHYRTENGASRLFGIHTYGNCHQVNADIGIDWCKDHHTFSMEFSSPVGARYLLIDHTGLNFHQEKYPL